MALWGNVDNAGSKPKFANTADVYGVDKTEATVSDFVTAPGWVKVKIGTGPVVAIAIAAAGTGYANGEVLTFTGGNGTGAAGTLTTNGSGVITAVNLTSGGSGYTAAPTVGITTAAGTGASLTATVGGRAGRISSETLVEISSITSDAADDAVFPDA